jgi:hypothetical protein
MIAKSLSTSRRYGRLHEVAGKRAEFCQALYPLLVAHADDFGRLAGDVYTVKHAIIPTSPRKERDLASALADLERVGLIQWYEFGDDKCIQITDFDEHQQGLHKRTKSVFPEPPGKVPEIPSEEKGTEQKGREEKYSAEFERFWSEYPRKEGKDAAWREWLKRSPSDDLLEAMIAKVRMQRASAQWQKDGGQFIPQPRTWLHQGRWQDGEIAQAAGPSPWTCPHVDRCSHRAMCESKTVIGPEKYPVKVAS